MHAENQGQGSWKFSSPLIQSPCGSGSTPALDKDWVHVTINHLPEAELVQVELCKCN